MKKNAFTLIELIMILLILAIVSRVAIPAYQNVANQAKAASVRATLDEVRAALKAYRSNRKLEGNTEIYPGLTELQDRNDQGGSCPTAHLFSDCNMPDNSFCSSATGGTHCSGNKDQVITGAMATRIIDSGTAAGWRYDSTTGLFYPNTTVMGENQW